MKAPNKCYITREKNGVIYSLSFNDNGGLEYIRKEAILEWANGQKKATEELIKEHPKDDSLWAEMHWYEQLIKHIESL